MNAWLLAGVLSLGLPAGVHAADGDEAVKSWLLDYAEAKAQAARTGKPIFIVFR